MLTISSGYDPGYLTRGVATGRENYYLSAVAEHGEPPGIWAGAGCRELGLVVGSEVDNKLMERLYGAFIDPRDPDRKATLGRAPSGFTGNSDKVSARIAALLAAEPEATPERHDQIIMQTMKDQRATVYFFDATFSVPKSVSLLHASLQVKAQQARDGGQLGEAQEWTRTAQVVWDAILAGNQAMLEYLQREAGYSRAGYHSKDSGRFVDAHDWVIASFAQHTSRDNDPQLHVHNAILNRVLRDDPLAARAGGERAWRTLDGAALYAAKPAAGAIAERTMNGHLTDRLGVQMIARPDGNGWEIGGISEAAREQFSSRRRTIEPRLQDLITEYERRHGKAPNARAVWSMAQFVTLDSRQPKSHSAASRETLLARWDAQSRRAETEALSAIPDAALHRRGPGVEPDWPTEAQIDMILAAAVADAQRRKATFTRYELTRMISRHLPGYSGGLTGKQVSRLLEDLADQALQPGGACETVLLTAPEMVPVPQAYRRQDGLSLWRRHGAEVYTTRAMLDTETRLLRAAARSGAPRIAPERAAAALGTERERVEARLWRDYAHDGAATAPGGAAATQDGAEKALSSAGLADDQAQAAYGILTSGRAIDILVGPAGAGKTRTVARIADAWRDASVGRVIGLTVSTSAARTLATEGIGDSHNLATFLGRLPGDPDGRGHLPVRPGDLLVIDEASMVPTTDLAEVEAIATRWGAKILLTGDTEQLSAPEEGGALRLLAGEHGYYQLVTVQRFDEQWEREASLRLRAGDCEVLAEYDRRGRILEGTREEMSDAAYRRWLADHLSGKLSMLLATTNAQATELARRARDELAELELVATDNLVDLADGNVAGVGDLIVARKNTRIWAGGDGRSLANRDVLRIDAWDEIDEERTAIVRRVAGRDPATGETLWSVPFELTEKYIKQHADLAYARNVHVAEGTTVATGHLLIDDTAGRAAQYVGLTRGRERNTAYVVTEYSRGADLSPELRTTPDIEDPIAADKETKRPNRFAVLGAVMERDQAERTATETMRGELDRAASLATLAPIWTDLTRTHATRRYDSTIRSLLPAEEWQRYEQDSERGTLERLLRATELAGHEAAGVLGSATEGRNFTGARSVAAILHGRVRRIVGTPEPAPGSTYLDRTPAIDDPAADQFARDLAMAMDARAAVLGNEAALDRPAWATTYLGQVPAETGARAEWIRRASTAAAYREERGYHHDTDAIGPAPDRASPEQRASWLLAYLALRIPDEHREVAAAGDGELWSRRAAYARETAWAPPYVTRQLREAHIAEDTYRADAVRAWHQADAAAENADRTRIRQEAQQHAALAQEVGAYREALAEITEGRRQWHAATELGRQRALMADTELRRRHPDLELPPLHPEAEAADLEQDVKAAPGDRQRDAGATDSGARATEDEAGRVLNPPAAALDLASALDAARRAQAIIAERDRMAERDTDRAGDDVMRERQTEAEREVSSRRSAVRQAPAPGRGGAAIERDETELEAGR